MRWRRERMRKRVRVNPLRMNMPRLIGMPSIK